MSNKVFRLGANGIERIDNGKDIPAGTPLYFKGYEPTTQIWIVTHRKDEWSNNQQEIIREDGKGRSYIYPKTIHPYEEQHGIGYYFLPEKWDNKQPYDEKQIAALIEKWEQHTEKEQKERKEKETERERLIEKGRHILKNAAPNWAKAIIVANCRVNDSDAMTDYFSYHSVRHVVLAFSRHTRNNFDEMRNAAKLFEKTKHLTDSKEYEQRENYSMGGGYYLGTGRYSGWIVRKENLKYNLDSYYLSIGKDPANLIAKTEQPAELPTIENVTVSFNEEKNGIEIRFPEKPDSSVLSALKENGWRWSRFNKCWYNKDNDENREFARTFH